MSKLEVSKPTQRINIAAALKELNREEPALEEKKEEPVVEAIAKSEEAKSAKEGVDAAAVTNTKKVVAKKEPSKPKKEKVTNPSKKEGKRTVIADEPEKESSVKKKALVREIWVDSIVMNAIQQFLQCEVILERPLSRNALVNQLIENTLKSSTSPSRGTFMDFENPLAPSKSNYSREYGSREGKEKLMLHLYGKAQTAFLSSRKQDSTFSLASFVNKEMVPYITKKMKSYTEEELLVLSDYFTFN